MAKKVVTIYTCDACNKQVENKKELRLIKIGKPFGEKLMEEENFDICEKCYEKIGKLFGKDKPEPKKAPTIDKNKEQIKDAYERGLTRKQMVLSTGLTMGQVNYYVNLLRAEGVERGSKMGEYHKEHKDPFMTTVVDSEGMVLAIK